MAEKPSNAPTPQQVSDAQHLDNMTSLQQPSAAEQSSITQNGEVKGDAPVSTTPTPSPDNPSLFNEPKNPNNKVVEVESQKVTEDLGEGATSDTSSDQGSKFTEDLNGLKGDAVNATLTVQANGQGTQGDTPPELDPGVNKAGGNSTNQGPTGGGGIPRAAPAPAGAPATASPTNPTSSPSSSQIVEPAGNTEPAPPTNTPQAPNPVTPQAQFIPEEVKVDQPSILTPDLKTIAEDSTAVGNVLSNDSDADSALAVTSFSVNGATYTPGQTVLLTGIGSVTIAADGTYLFTPEPNWNGVVPTINYSTNTEKQSTLNISVTPVDDSGTPVTDSKTIAEDTVAAGNVLANDVDIDSVLSVVSFRIAGVDYATGSSATIPGVGSVTISENGDYTFTPQPNYNGSVPPVLYSTNTGASEFLNITVTPVNDPPVAFNDSLVGAEDTAYTVSVADLFGNDNVGALNDLDVDSSSFTSITVTTLGSNGTLKLDGVNVTLNQVITSEDIASGKLTFIPDSNFNGDANFKYTVSDGLLSSNEATVTTVVNPVIDTATVTLSAPRDIDESTGSVIYTVAVDNAPQGGPLTLTINVGGEAREVTIAEGSFSNTFAVDTRSDDVYDQGGDTINVVVTDAAGGGYEYLDYSTASDSYVVSDDVDPVTVSIAGNGPVLENVAPTFTVSISEALLYDLVVTLSNTETVTIYAGDTEATYTASVQGDDIYQDGSTLTLSVSSAELDGGTQTLENLEISATSASVVISDTIDTVTLKVVACDINGNNIAATNSGAESTSLYYKVVAYAPDGTTVVTGLDNSADVNVSFTNGTATSPDYSTTAATVKVGAVFSANLLDDYLKDSGETYTVCLTGAAPTQSTYEKVILSSSTVTSTITDEIAPGTEDTVYVRLYTNDSVNEVTGQTLDHTLKLVDKDGNAVNLATGKEITVNLSYSSDSTNSDDFSTKQTSVTIIGNGTATYSFANTVLDDSAVEGAESYTISIGSVVDGASAKASGFEALAADPLINSATGTIVDNDVALVSDISIWKSGTVYNGDGTSLTTIDSNNQVDSVNDYVKYTIIVKNTGGNTLTNIKLVDEKLAAGSYTLQVGTCNASGGEFIQTGTSTISGSVLNSELSLSDSLLVGQALRLVYVYDVTSDDIFSNKISNTIQVDTAQTDPGYKDAPTIANDGIASYEVLVEGISDVAIRKFADVHTANIGQTVNYKLIVTNEGTTNLTNVKISDKMIATTSDSDSIAAGKQIAGYIYTNGVKALTATNFTVDGAGNLVIGALSSNQYVEINYSHTITTSDYSIVSTGLVESVFDYTGVSKGPYNPDGDSSTADPITMSYGTFSAYVNKTATDPYATGGTAANIFINTDNTGVAIGVNAGVMSGDRNYNSDHLKAVFNSSALNGGQSLVEKASIVFTNAKDVEVAFKAGYGTTGNAFMGSIVIDNTGAASLKEVVGGLLSGASTKTGSTTTFTSSQFSFTVDEAAGPGGAQNKLYTLRFDPGADFIKDFDFWVVGDPTDNSSDQIKVVDVVFDTIDFSVTNVTNTAIVTSTEDDAADQSDEIATVDVAVLANLTGDAVKYLGGLTTATNLVADTEAVISSSSGSIQYQYAKSTAIFGIQLPKLIITDANNSPTTVTQYKYTLEINGSVLNSQSVSTNEVTFNLSGITGTKKAIFHIVTFDNAGGSTEFVSAAVDIDTSKNNNGSLSYTVFSNASPIALDLNSNGVLYLSKDAGVTHDFNGDGIAESTAWVASEDGLLALQKEDGTHNIVFSTQAGETDLQGLAKVYDTNHDQVFDAKDAGFNQFGVWQDADSDGVVDAGEFLSLADRGIVSLSLTSDGVINTAADGDVTIFGQTTYTMADGSTGVAEDVAFAVSSVEPDGNGVQDIYQVSSIEVGNLAINGFNIGDGDRVDLSAILNPSDSVQSLISIDQDGSTSSHSTVTVNIGGVDYEVATLYGKEIGVLDALGVHSGGSSLSDALHGASWTDVVDVASDHGGPASISAAGGALTNSFSNEAGDWTVQIKSGTATVDAANKQISFTSDHAENSAVITTADGTAHEISNVDKILWH